MARGGLYSNSTTEAPSTDLCTSTNYLEIMVKNLQCEDKYLHKKERSTSDKLILQRLIYVCLFSSSQRPSGQIRRNGAYLPLPGLELRSSGRDELLPMGVRGCN